MDQRIISEKQTQRNLLVTDQHFTLGQDCRVMAGNSARDRGGGCQHGGKPGSVVQLLQDSAETVCFYHRFSRESQSGVTSLLVSPWKKSYAVVSVIPPPLFFFSCWPTKSQWESGSVGRRSPTIAGNSAALHLAPGWGYQLLKKLGLCMNLLLAKVILKLPPEAHYLQSPNPLKLLQLVEFVGGVTCLQTGGFWTISPSLLGSQSKVTLPGKRRSISQSWRTTRFLDH